MRTSRLPASRRSGRRHRAAFAAAVAMVGGVALSGCNPGSYALVDGAATAKFKNTPGLAVLITARVVGVPHDRSVRFRVGAHEPGTARLLYCRDAPDSSPVPCVDDSGFVGSSFITVTGEAMDQWRETVMASPGDLELKVLVQCDPGPCPSTARVELRSLGQRGYPLGDFT